MNLRKLRNITVSQGSWRDAKKSVKMTKIAQHVKNRSKWQKSEKMITESRAKTLKIYLVKNVDEQ